MKTKIYKNEMYKNDIQKSYDELVKEWNCEVHEFSIQGQYGSTNVLEVGTADKMPLILFHGVGDDSALMWIYNAQKLSEHFHVYAVDAIGGPGKSVPGAGYDKSFEDEKWIDEILDYLKIDKAYFAGVSNGGYLVQMYSIKRPEHVIKGICMAAAPAVHKDDKGGNGKGGAMKIMMKVFLPEAFFPTDKNIKKLISKMTGSNYGALTENAVVYRHFKQLMLGFNRAAMLYHKVYSFTEANLLSVKNKLMFIEGTKDPFMLLGGEEITRALAEKGSINVTWVDDAGHGLNQEKAEEINEMIVDYFLD